VTTKWAIQAHICANGLKLLEAGDSTFLLSNSACSRRPADWTSNSPESVVMRSSKGRRAAAQSAVAMVESEAALRVAWSCMSSAPAFMTRSNISLGQRSLRCFSSATIVFISSAGEKGAHSEMNSLGATMALPFWQSRASKAVERLPFSLRVSPLDSTHRSAASSGERRVLGKLSGFKLGSTAAATLSSRSRCSTAVRS